MELLLMPDLGKVVIVAAEVVVVDVWYMGKVVVEDVWDMGKVYMGSEVVG